MPSHAKSDATSISDLVRGIRPGRRIRGMSAILLPFKTGGAIDWAGLARQIERAAGVGLRPAVNMDTGYGQLLDDAERNRVLDLAETCSSEGFVGGVHVVDAPGDGFDADGYARGIEAVQARGGLPIVFPSHGLSSLPPEEWVEAHRGLARYAPRLLAFELGPMFVPYGRIYPLEAYRGLMEIPQCMGAKHSSLSREREWERLALRDAVRPDFLVLTGNDLAIDMVMYGSDYLLGLASFAPDLFAKRDAQWEAGDPRFYELNDRLQALGSFAFREPVPAYKHDAATFLHLRGWIASDRTHPGSPERPAADRAVLEELARRLGILPG
jgi:dihydrodipicolinate synthase/N-acetylneuraminate lyase